MRGAVVAIAGLILAVELLSFTPGVSAAILCRTVAGKQVCVESIKRSAKYHWEYRVVMNVDGERQTLKRYDCRQDNKLKQTSEKLSEEGAIHQFICNLTQH